MGNKSFRGPSFKKNEDDKRKKSSSKSSSSHISRAFISKVLSQLQNLDMNASAKAGEMRFPVSEAQSAFMKLIKKGLLLLIVTFGLSLSAHAQVYKETYDIPKMQGKLYVELEGVENIHYLKDRKVGIDSRYHDYEGNFNSRKIKIHATFTPNSNSTLGSGVIYGIHLDFYRLTPTIKSPGYYVDEKDYHISNEIKVVDDEYVIWGAVQERSNPGGSVTIDYTYTIPDDFYGCLIMISPATEADGPMGGMLTDVYW